MGYRSDIRIVTSEKGFEELKKFVLRYLNEHSEKYNLLEECDIKEQGKGQCYLGWNSLKWYDGYHEVDAIMQGLDYLEENEYSYRYMIMGEDYADIEEKSYDGEKDEDVYLEYPTMIRDFDDEYIFDLIKDKEKSIESEKNKEIIEI